MNEKKYRVKGYKHLDNKKSIEKVKSKIQNPRWVAKHGFYPFMHFEIKFQKYSRKEKSEKKKFVKFSMRLIWIDISISTMGTS